MRPNADPSPYSIEPRCKFFEMNQSILKYEVRPRYSVTFFSEIDLSVIERIRSKAKANRKDCPTYTAFVVKAAAIALKEHPHANRRVAQWWRPFSNSRLQKFNTVDLSVAAERLSDNASMAAFIDVIQNADKKSLTEITGWLRQLAQADVNNNRQWRDFDWIVTKLPHWLGKHLLRLPLYFPRLWPKYRGGAALVSSPGKYGVDMIAATWVAPLGISFGHVKQRPVVKNGKVVPCRTFHLTLNFDRRILAGAQAAQFFHRIQTLLETGMEKHDPHKSGLGKNVFKQIY